MVLVLILVGLDGGVVDAEFEIPAVSAQNIFTDKAKQWVSSFLSSSIRYLASD